MKSFNPHSAVKRLRLGDRDRYFRNVGPRCKARRKSSPREIPASFPVLSSPYSREVSLPLFSSANRLSPSLAVPPSASVAPVSRQGLSRGQPAVKLKNFRAFCGPPVDESPGVHADWLDYRLGFETHQTDRKICRLHNSARSYVHVRRDTRTHTSATFLLARTLLVRSYASIARCDHRRKRFRTLRHFSSLLVIFLVSVLHFLGSISGENEVTLKR